MATVNLGRIKPVFRGAYNNSTAYVIDDIVTSGNETFIAIAATQGNATTDASKWTKLAAKGADGTDVAAVLANKEIAFKTNAGALDGIPIGTAGQFLKVNSGATGYEFGAVTAGVTNYCAFRANSNYSGNLPADTVLINTFSGTPLNANGTFTVPTAGNYFLSYSTMNRIQGSANDGRIKKNGSNFTGIEKNILYKRNRKSYWRNKLYN